MTTAITKPAARSTNNIRPTDCTPERIADLARTLSASIDHAVEQIEGLNRQSRMLSFNAQVEAARSGAAGSTFQVVALAMQKLSASIGEVAALVNAETRATSGELDAISKVLATHVRGTRLVDLAMTNIDLIDRNLYERSCDCRWWATDRSLVDALTQKTTDACAFASHRLGVILNAYTVYFDLVLADLDGNVVANGRPRQFRSQRTNHATAKWFKSALATQSGDEFGFESVHESPLVRKQRALVYSAGVRAEGRADGELLGVLGIIFNWDALAQTIVTNTPLAREERNTTRVCIVDDSGLLLADSRDQQLRQSLDFPEWPALLQAKKDCVEVSIEGRKQCVAFAKSQGFETYATGWNSVILQRLV